MIKKKNRFLRGFGSVINLAPRPRKAVFTVRICSNEDAFNKDLQQVGEDINSAIKCIDKKIAGGLIGGTAIAAIAIAFIKGPKE